MNNSQNLPSLFFTKANQNLDKTHLLKIDPLTNKIKSWKRLEVVQDFKFYVISLNTLLEYEVT